MADIVNLRTARKRRTKEREQAAADARRALHGRTKGEEKLEERMADLAKRKLEAHLRDAPTVDDPKSEDKNG
jgi:hypothetical protein